jgi:thiamine-monophosphate kinase
MTETAFHAWLARRAPNFGAGLRLGIGDDCAIYRPQAGEELVFTTDFTIEGRHFTRQDFTPQQAGAKALCRSLSDIAAMAAKPVFALLSVAAPAEDPKYLQAFFSGIFSVAKKYQVSIAGGDLSRSDRLHCDVTVCGSVPRAKALLRSGAKVGDRLYVTGPLGVWKKRITPRLDLAEFLRNKANACMDITDGLSTDLDRLLRASGVTAELTGAPKIHRGATLEAAWHHGEDYELLVASPHDLPFTQIGVVVAGRPGSPLPPRGWDHFR